MQVSYIGPCSVNLDEGGFMKKRRRPLPDGVSNLYLFDASSASVPVETVARSLLCDGSCLSSMDAYIGF